MAKGTDNKEITADETLINRGRQIIIAYFHKMMANEAGAKEGTNIEHLHDMRVVSRRLREAMCKFRRVLPKETVQKTL